MRYIFHGIVITFFACTGRTLEEQNREERTPARTIQIILTRDGKTVSNPEVEISFVKGAGDTTRITSADGILEAPPYDSALTFYRVRYETFKADMMGPFLDLEFSGMITPEIRKWWIEIDTPPFSGRQSKYYPTKIPYLFSIYLDEKGLSGITVIGRVEAPVYHLAYRCPQDNAPCLTVPMHQPFRDLITLKHPGDVVVPVEHDAAQLLVRQNAFDTEVSQGAMGDSQHLPNVGAF